MDIEKMDKENEPGYPTLSDHRINRRSALRTLVGGLAVVGLVGCKEEEKPDYPQILGDMVAPSPPGKPKDPLAEPPVRLKGEMMAPEPPAKPDRPQVDGGMMMPKKPDHPQKPGEMPAPKKPDHPRPEDSPAPGGIIAAPKPAKK